MKESKDKILKLAKEQLKKNREEIHYLRKTARRKGPQRFTLAYPHLTTRVTDVKDGKIKLSATGARCVLLENKKPIGSIAFVKRKGQLKFSHVSFDKDFSKMFTKLSQQVEKELPRKSNVLPESIDLIPFGTSAVRYKVARQFKFVTTTTKKYKLLDQKDVAEDLAALLGKRDESEAEFRSQSETT